MSAIENSLHISRRTIYREFSELKLYLQQHGLSVQNADGHYRLSGPIRALDGLRTELQGQNERIELTAKQRQDALACLLLLSDEPVKIFSLAVSLDVSEGTIQRDLKVITAALKEYQVKVVPKKAVGIQTVGQETQIRLILCGILTSEINEYEFFEYLNSQNDYQPHNFFLKLCPKEILLACAKALKQATGSKLAHNSDVQEVQLILIIAISVIRMTNNTIRKYQVVDVGDLFKYRQRALEILNHFDSRIKEKITTSEVDFIAIQIKGLDYKLVKGDWAHNYDFQISFNVKQLIQEVSETFHWNFSRDTELFARLVKHMTFLLHNEGVKLPNTRIKVLNNVSVQYASLYQLLQGALAKVFTGYDFTETEEQLILLYFANSYASTKSNYLSALVICPNGIGTASILKSRLRREIPELAEIKIAKVSQLNEIHPNHYDVILSTLSLPGFDWNYHIVSPLLVGDEIARIKSFINQFNLEYKRKTVREGKMISLEEGQQRLEELFDMTSESKMLVDQIRLEHLNNNNEKLAELLVQVLAKVPTAVVKEPQQVVHEMLKRVKAAPVGIPNASISLVHATDKSVLKPFFSVYELRAPLTMKAMDQTPIQVKRILLMIGPAPMTDFQNNLMGTISGAIVMNNRYTAIFEKGNVDKIKNLIAAQFMEQLEFKRKR
ncbi:transcription regulator [Liquorilactobacillus capillatus DSM 19910]|uniref:Transcription regulator n=2 Tax=Liquorilactobacillus capillatus TaxID=480931 RepID=A0A0R1ME33_9LACO|nr:transcription regulator [Liquorilactobacillus capillatus DSM 19910]